MTFRDFSRGRLLAAVAKTLRRPRFFARRETTRTALGRSLRDVVERRERERCEGTKRMDGNKRVTEFFNRETETALREKIAALETRVEELRIEVATARTDCETLDVALDVARRKTAAVERERDAWRALADMERVVAERRRTLERLKTVVVKRDREGCPKK